MMLLLATIFSNNGRFPRIYHIDNISPHCNVFSLSLSLAYPSDFFEIEHFPETINNSKRMLINDILNNQKLYFHSFFVELITISNRHCWLNAVVHFSNMHEIRLLKNHEHEFKRAKQIPNLCHLGIWYAILLLNYSNSTICMANKWTNKQTYTHTQKRSQ